MVVRQFPRSGTYGEQTTTCIGILIFQLYHYFLLGVLSWDFVFLTGRKFVSGPLFFTWSAVEKYHFFQQVVLLLVLSLLLFVFPWCFGLFTGRSDVYGIYDLVTQPKHLWGRRGYQVVALSSLAGF
jgi:hypothetical protein